MFKNEENSSTSNEYKSKNCTCESTSSDLCKNKWTDFIKKSKLLKDPWKDFGIETLEEHTGIRYRFNINTKQWVDDVVKFKIQTQPFDKGSMRACYRMKKLSNFTKNSDWLKAENIVAKRFMNEVPQKQYFDDVYLQMFGKIEANEYNKTNPPKKIDMIQLSVLKATFENKEQYFHLEHFIEGKYMKYNSNSGFVENNQCRFTPQTFSHFTFEKSKGKFMIVDIQGVDDMYTDPQVHSLDEMFTSDGNLGVKGFSLFFASHICNPICRFLQLTPFHLSKTELDYYSKFAIMKIDRNSTVVSEFDISVEPVDENVFDVENLLTNSGYNKDSIYMLSNIHWQLAVYHYINYFKIEEINRVEACSYHILKSVKLQHKLALSNFSRWLLGIPTDCDISFDSLNSSYLNEIKNESDDKTKLSLLMKASDLDCFICTKLVAEYFDKNSKVFSNENKFDDVKSLEYYLKLLESDRNIVEHELHEPIHIIMSKVGTIYSAMENYDKARYWYESAAENAMERMQGKTAMVYYELIENLP